MQTISVKLTKPHGGQLRVLREAKRFNVLRCGRRFGKTRLGMNIASEASIRGQRVGWFAPTYKIFREAFDEITKELGEMIQRVDRQEKRIELHSGGVIDFWTLDTPDPARGRKYHVVIIDEAGMSRNLKTCWLSAIRPTLTDYKGSAWFLGTPKGGGYFGQLYNMARKDAKGWASWQLGTVDNPTIDPEEVEEARQQMPESIFRQEYLGEPDDEGGNPFGLSKIAACFAKDSGTPGACVAYGVDLAKSFDWTWVVGLDASGREVLSDRWQMPWGDSREKLVQIIGDTPALIDSTGVGDPIMEDIARVCPNAEGFKFSRTSKQQLMEGLRSEIHQEALRLSDDRLMAELEMFTYQYRPGGGVTWTAPEGFHDDGVCALALSVECKRRANQKIPIVFSGLDNDSEPYKPDPFEDFAGDPFE